MKPIAKKQYDEMVKQASDKSPVLKNSVLAFIFGGLICSLGQLLCNLYMDLGFQEKEARAAVSLSLILIAAILTMVGVYDRISKHAGAGMLIPITGFSNSMVAAGIEYKSEGLVMGVGAKLFTIAGPVIVYGISASVIYGLVLFILQQFRR